MSRLISLLGLLVALAGIGLLVGQVVAVHSPIVPGTPVANPGAGSYASTQSVTLASPLSTSIYYTVDGSTPSCAGTGTSSLYSTAISVSTSETLKAIGCVGAYQPGGVLSAAYTINGAAGTPTFSPAAGTISSGTTVTISTSASGCSSYIYWSFTNNPPTNSDTNSTTSSAITTTSTLYAKVIGCPGWSDSSVGSAAYTVSGGGFTYTNGAFGHISTGAGTVTFSNVACGSGQGLYVVIVAGLNATTATIGGATFTLQNNHTDTASGGSVATFDAENVTLSTVTITVTGTYHTTQFLCFNWPSGAALDSAALSGVSNQNIVAGNAPCGTLTPTYANELVVAGMVLSGTPAMTTVTASFNFLNSVAYSSGNYFGGAFAYKIKTDSLAESPIFSSSSADFGCDLTSWKP